MKLQKYIDICPSSIINAIKECDDATANVPKKGKIIIIVTSQREAKCKYRSTSQ